MAGGNTIQGMQGTTSHQTEHTQQTGRLGRFFVVAEHLGGPGKVAEWQVHLESNEISLWERFTNWFTGHLVREQNAAYIDFIRNGATNPWEATDENPVEQAEKRLQVFEDIIAGKTKATYEEKLAACDAMEVWIRNLGEAKNSGPVKVKEITDEEVLKKLKSYAQMWSGLDLRRDLLLGYMRKLLELCQSEAISMVDLAAEVHRLAMSGDEKYAELEDASKEFFDWMVKTAPSDEKTIGAHKQVVSEVKKKIGASIGRAFDSHQRVYVSFFQTERFRTERETLIDKIFNLSSILSKGKTHQEMQDAIGSSS